MDLGSCFKKDTKMHACVISHSFPTCSTIDFVFVEQLCKKLADNGIQITIIAPQSVTKWIIRHVPIVPRKSHLQSDKGAELILYRPYWVSLGTGCRGLNTMAFNLCVNMFLNRTELKVDLFYCHFWAQAVAVCKYAFKYNIPVVVAAGEGRLTTHLYMTQKQISAVRKVVKGVICVSSKSKHESISAGFTDGKNCRVIPNGVDLTLFRKYDRHEVRRKYNFPEDAFIVIFVGQFVQRKGVVQLVKALESINEDRIKAIFAGSGPEQPHYINTIFQGTIPHDKLPEYLSAADIFVLPTYNEGCSNAIVEAMACGLPVLSSDLEFNKDILNSANSILFNPDNIGEIAAAIRRMMDDESERERLSEGALATAKSLDLKERSVIISEYLREIADKSSVYDE